MLLRKAQIREILSSMVEASDLPLRLRFEQVKIKSDNQTEKFARIVKSRRQLNDTRKLRIGV